MTGTATALERLGWLPVFSDQTAGQDLDTTPPVRVIEVHRSGLRVLGDGIDTTLPPSIDATVGDWLLLDRVTPADSLLLTRTSLFERRAPGTERRQQLIAANVDTAFIVTSCNADFNVARLERYVALAFEADVTPVIILTKADLCEDPAPFVTDAQSISRHVAVTHLNALGDAPTRQLAQWCRAGQTVVFMGSSGVGKSTLVNALLQTDVAQTAGIRDNDAKGRHTTTHRALRFTDAGCAVLDTPGMRALPLANVQAGLDILFADLVDLSRQCRFRDCAHASEPGCAITAALAAGTIDAPRLARWQKLDEEGQDLAAALAARKSGEKSAPRRARVAPKKKRK